MTVIVAPGSSVVLPSSVPLGTSGGAITGPAASPSNISTFHLRDEFTLNDFGPPADGSTLNDTNFAEGITYLSAHGGRALIVPNSASQWRISTPIVLPKVGGVELRGKSQNSAIIGADPSFTGVAMVTNQYNDGSQEYAWVTNLTLEAGNVAASCIIFDTIYHVVRHQERVVLSGDRPGDRLHGGHARGWRPAVDQGHHDHLPWQRLAAGHRRVARHMAAEH
jgi:hypothetical protein